MKTNQQTIKQNQSEKIRLYAKMFADILIQELIRQKEIKLNLSKNNKKN